MNRAARCACAAVCLAMLVTLTGCWVPSVNPLYGKADTFYDSGLEGTWMAAEGHSSMKFARNSAGACYVITYTEREQQSRFDGCLTRIGHLTFLDIAPTEPNLPEAEQAHLLPLHSFWRLEIAGDSFSLQTLETNWFKERVAKNQPVPAHLEPGDDFILTASTAALRAFFQRYGAQDALFTEKSTYQRQK